VIARLREFIANPVVIGDDACPILHRWALYGGGVGTTAARQGVRPLFGWDATRFSVKLHRFLPHADDRSVHDHPWAFYTLVLRGYYDDMAACPDCDGIGQGRIREHLTAYCFACHGQGVVLRERMSPGKLRFRPATHSHRTRVGPRPCWTVVVTGPRVRDWGFWRGDRWWQHKDYEAEFGPAMRCE
jgi:hypothetical protein